MLCRLLPGKALRLRLDVAQQPGGAGSGGHAEFFDLRQRVVHGWGAVDAGVVLAVLAYAACYCGGLLALSRLALGKKKL